MTTICIFPLEPEDGLTVTHEGASVTLHEDPATMVKLCVPPSAEKLRDDVPEAIPSPPSLLHETNNALNTATMKVRTEFDQFLFFIFK